MEVINSPTICYTYTIKSLGSNLDADYTPFFDKLKKHRVKTEFKINERDSKGKSHYHGILYLEKGFWRKRLCCKGFNLQLAEPRSKKAWIKYIHKDVHWDDYEDDDDEKIEMPTKRLF